MPQGVSHEEEKAALEAVLASQIFSKSQSLARLLSYICGKYFDGRACDLKEYNIGVEALGRPPDFDPTSNSVVRVELHRLRDKLKKYYETEGVRDPVAVVLEPGKYAPHFSPHVDVAAQAATPASNEAGNRIEGQEKPTAPDLIPEPSGISTRTGLPSRPPWRSHRLSRPLVAMLAFILVAAAAFVWKGKLLRFQATNSDAFGIEGGKAVIGGEPGQALRILAGYSRNRYIDHAGEVWGPDRYYTGGTVLGVGPQLIARTSDATVYQTCRYGAFRYDIPLEPGVYELRLHFAEIVYGAGSLAGGGESSRIFNVEMNGKPILAEFDPLADAGAPNTADVRVFRDVTPAPDGQLHLRFFKYQGPTPPQDEAILNALEIVPGIPGRMHPVRIVAQANSYTDHAGEVWKPDNYAHQGRLVLHNRPVSQTSDPDLYLGERFGHFSYAIPVAEGRYALALHFAETYFGPQNPGGGGVGSRLFDVYCNGVRILHEFDILKEAGSANRALVKTFHNLEPNPQGKLLLTFVPMKNYACVNAIEVRSEP
ncbi:MAG: malectin domain-containing carbohydrate-binding protein [Terriglobia bacterium]